MGTIPPPHRVISTQNAASSVAVQYQRIGEFPLQSRRHSPKRDDRCCEGIEECRDQEGNPELGKAQDLFRGKSGRFEGETEECMRPIGIILLYDQLSI